jgi:hypothetical protein
VVCCFDHTKKLSNLLSQLKSIKSKAREQASRVAQVLKWKEEGAEQNVLCKLYVNSISDISTAESAMTVDLGVCMWYYDKHHVGVPEGEPDFEKRGGWV